MSRRQINKPEEEQGVGSGAVLMKYLEDYSECSENSGLWARKGIGKIILCQ